MRLGLGLGVPLKRRVVISANSAPSAISISHNEATEDLAVGLAIGTLSTTDADAGDTHTYALVSDVSGKFSISGNELVLVAPLDYETATSHSVTIRSTDSSGNSVQQVFTITVLDFNEVDTHGPLIVDTASGIVDDGGFTVGPIVGDGSGGIKIQGKNGGLAKFIYDIGPPQAGYTYTVRYDPDFTRLSNTGKEAFVGFGFKSSNDFHFTGLKGDGATGLNAFKIYGAGKFNQSSGFTTVDDGAAAFGTQAGPNWLRIVIASDGTTYTLSTSSDGQNWTAEFTASTPSPLTNATDAGQFGIAVFLENSDKGQFSVQITVWAAVSAAETDPNWANVVFLSSWDGVDEATTFTDESSLARAITRNGNSKLDSAVTPPYGYTTAVLCPAAGDFPSLAASAHNNLGTTWSVEYSIYHLSLATHRFHIGQLWLGGGFDSWTVFTFSDGNVYFRSYDGAAMRWDINSGAGAIAATTWYKMALSSDGTKVRVFKDGVMITSVTPASTQLGNATYYGCFGSGGYLDTGNTLLSEVRITKGVCRSYLASDSSYTPSTTSFPRS